MLPNGGFPPLKICDEDNKKKTDSKEKEKGFFYSTKTNTINIREILKKSSKKVIVDSNREEDIEIVNSL